MALRQLNAREIGLLEQQGCTAQDWNTVFISEPFQIESVRNVDFYDNVEIGDLSGTIKLPGEIKINVAFSTAG